MIRNLTDKQKGIILFILFAVGLVIIAIFAISSSIPVNTEAKYSTPKPTEEIAVPNQEYGNPTLEAKRVEKLIAILPVVAGFDYSFPPNTDKVSANPELSDGVKSKILDIYKTYDVESLTTEQYVKTVSMKIWKDISTEDDNKKGYYVYQVDASVEEGKNGGPVEPVSTEVWKITIQEQDGKNVIVDFEKIS